MAQDYAYFKRWRYDRDQGITRTVDATEARQHVHGLLEAGWSLRSIAGEAGLSPNAIMRIRDGQETVKRDTAAKVLAVKTNRYAARPVPGHADVFVPKIGAVRRIQALLFLGWTHADMRAHCGIATALVPSQPGEWITRSKHDKVAAMYRVLAMRQGPSAKTRGWARKLGYLGPTAWDNIDIDAEGPRASTRQQTTVVRSDEDGYLDEAAIWRRMHGDRVRLTHAEAAEVVHRLRAAGQTEKAIYERTGINPHRHLAEGAA